MVSITLSELRERLDDVVERLASGEEIEIARFGKPGLKLAAVPVGEVAYRPVDLERLEAFAKTLPYQQESAGDFMRRMRDDYRY